MKNNKKIRIIEDLSSSLVLPKIFAKILGFNDLIEIIELFDKKEYEFETQESNLITILKKYQIQVEYPFNVLNEEKLIQYDLNIKKHIDKVNSKRNIKIKAYQFLALLVTEIYLDLYFKHKKNRTIDEFIKFLNICMEEIKLYAEINPYTINDLEKICFWMATGSGKTIVMHVNFHQYTHYLKKYSQKINHYLLITPNEDLSKQHEKELKKSKIDSFLIDKTSAIKKIQKIKIIEIHKLSEKTQIKRIDTSAFGKNNLIMVDEGHRGGSGESWLKHRQNIATEGFTIEYSATFTLNKKKEYADYSKTILFDYSYKYYHKQGYGKDYFIVNINNEKTNEKEVEIQMMFINLLSFYQQKKLFLKNKDYLEKKLKIQDPLWILVGSSVLDKEKTTKKEGKEIDSSDILKFINFLNSIKKNKEFYKKQLQKIIENQHEIINNNELKNKFEYIKSLKETTNENFYDYLMEDIFKKIFHTNYKNEASLVLTNIKESDGEIGLKFDDSENYFGLIYVGKQNDKKIINSIKKNVKTSEDSMKKDLFKKLDEKKEFPINILIGAKKFIEGWDNYRVSSILLMNFAKNKGVSAIQLFGRGVRLKGYEKSMKRSTFTNPPLNSKSLRNYLKILETLNVFGINAKYMKEFKKELEQDVYFYIQREIEVNKNYNFEFLKCIENDSDYKETFQNKDIFIEEEELKEEIMINLNKKLETIQLNKSFNNENEIFKIKNKKIINPFFYNLVNWNEIIKEIRDFKKNKNYYNLSVPNTKEELKEILEKEKITIQANKNYLNDLDFDNLFSIKNSMTNWIEKIQNIYIRIIKKYLSKIYLKKYKKFYNENFKLIEIRERNILEKYEIKIYDKKIKNEEEEIQKILEQMIKKKEKIFNFEDILNFEKNISKNLENELYIEFEKHIYKPLLINSKNSEIGDRAYLLNPSGLNKGEKRFILDLKAFLNKKTNISFNVFVMRNHENRGFGYFLKTKKYYPDFIIWLIKNKKQKIIFIDPKGMVFPDKEKINFNKEIADIEKKIKKKEKNEDFELFSFIVTETNEKYLGENIEENGIYKMDDDNKYLEKIFKKVDIENF